MFSFRYNTVSTENTTDGLTNDGEAIKKKSVNFQDECTISCNGSPGIPIDLEAMTIQNLNSELSRNYSQDPLKDTNYWNSNKSRKHVSLLRLSQS
ncbi:hypothetical protein Ciccas_001537 [Cichlidogyrus casuarinus]|uniref:Uncharacterized protein n=1 Tax=Cichlidogyrus casuarinus TaxID=1844966 RepID=A0ABD2QJS1_9PLAT